MRGLGDRTQKTDVVPEDRRSEVVEVLLGIFVIGAIRGLAEVDQSQGARCLVADLCPVPVANHIQLVVRGGCRCPAGHVGTMCLVQLSCLGPVIGEFIEGTAVVHGQPLNLSLESNSIDPV